MLDCDYGIIKIKGLVESEYRHGLYAWLFGFQACSDGISSPNHVSRPQKNLKTGTVST